MRKLIVIITLGCFLTTSEIGSYALYAQPAPPEGGGAIALPVPGTMVDLSPSFEPVLIKGLTVHPENPFLFDFIVDLGDGHKDGRVMKPPLREESIKLIKYFLAAMTVPEKDLWVNLSPYEKERIIAPNLGETEMGRDMLAEDYILKQLTASLIYPEKHLGKTFWDDVYAKARVRYGTTQIPVNTFNKVWIVADKADVFEQGQTAYVVGAHLKVMLEEDYLSLMKNTTVGAELGLRARNIGRTQGPPLQSINSLGSQIVRQIILPAIEKEVNQGKNFAPLRQIFYSMILASWYKTALKGAILNQVYANKSKVKVGINQDDPKANEEIFQRYLKAYKKGVFNYIKNDLNDTNGQTIPRKYFSGGVHIDLRGVSKNFSEFLMPPKEDRFEGKAFVKETITVNPAREGGRSSAAMASSDIPRSQKLDRLSPVINNAKFVRFIEFTLNGQTYRFGFDANGKNIFKYSKREAIYATPGKPLQTWPIRTGVQNGPIRVRELPFEIEIQNTTGPRQPWNGVFNLKLKDNVFTTDNEVEVKWFAPSSFAMATSTDAAMEDSASAVGDKPIKVMDVLKFLNSKWGMRQLLKGGTIRQPEWFMIFKRDQDRFLQLPIGAKDGSYSQELTDTVDLSDFKDVAHRIVDGHISLPVIFKPNRSALGEKIFYIEKGQGRNLVITFSYTTSGQAPNEYQAPVISYFSKLGIQPRFTEGEDIMQFDLDASKVDAADILDGLWKMVTLDNEVYDTGGMESVFNTFKYYGKSYESRLTFRGNTSTGYFEPTPEDPYHNNGWEQSTRVGSSSYFANFSGRSKAEVLNGPDMYRAVLIANQIDPKRWEAFEAYAYTLIEADFKLMVSRLRQAGISLDENIRGNFDLQWLPSEKPGEFPVPVLIESSISSNPSRYISTGSILMRGDFKGKWSNAAMAVSKVERALKIRFKNVPVQMVIVDGEKKGSVFVQLWGLTVTDEDRFLGPLREKLPGFKITMNDGPNHDGELQLNFVPKSPRNAAMFSSRAQEFLDQGVNAPNDIIAIEGFKSMPNWVKIYTTLINDPQKLMRVISPTHVRLTKKISDIKIAVRRIFGDNSEQIWSGLRTAFNQPEKTRIRAINEIGRELYRYRPLSAQDFNALLELVSANGQEMTNARVSTVLILRKIRGALNHDQREEVVDLLTERILNREEQSFFVEENICYTLSTYLAFDALIEILAQRNVADTLQETILRIFNKETEDFHPQGEFLGQLEVYLLRHGMKHPNTNIRQGSEKLYSRFFPSGPSTGQAEPNAAMAVSKVERALKIRFRNIPVHMVIVDGTKKGSVFVQLWGLTVTDEERLLGPLRKMLPGFKITMNYGPNYDGELQLNFVPKSRPSPAMTHEGGIDLTRTKEKIIVSREGQGVQMQFDPAMLERIQREGFDGLEFQIESIVPISLNTIFAAL